MDSRLSFNQAEIDWDELAQLYEMASLGPKKPNELEIVFSNSLYKCFIFEGDTLIAAGRALADGLECAYLCDIAVNPKCQGHGLGKQVVQNLIEKSKGHKKIILYACPGKEGFYAKLGFKKMNTAMAIFQNEEEVINCGIIS